MDPIQNDMTPHQAAEALRWLSEMGADEIIGETPVNRLAAAAPRAAMVEGVPGPALLPATTAAVTPPGPVAAGAPAAQYQSLRDIEQALEAFDACPLKKTATRLCFSDGNPAARVMLIGEAPGREEDIEGRPFAGRSGLLLDRMLAAVGLSRTAQDRESAVFITSTVFWRPPGNRNPTEAEIQMCLPFLLRMIELQQPDIIVCLGVMPVHRLTGSKGSIINLRGRWLSMAAGGRSIPVLPSLNPDYLLRQPAQKRLAWRDLLGLRQMLDAH